MTHSKLCGALMLATVALLTAGPLAAQTVSGSFTVDGHAVTPTQAAAFRVRDRANPRSYESLVVLTGAALDLDHVTESMDPYASAINDPAARGKDYVLFFVGADGTVNFNGRSKGIPFVDGSGMVMRQPGNLRAECPVNEPERVECRIWAEEAVKTSEGETWTLDMRFAADVRMRALGAPVPEGGGEAGAALLELVAALKEGKLDQILAHLLPDDAQAYQGDYQDAEAHLASAQSVLGSKVPLDAVVMGGEQLADDHIVLEVEGSPYPEYRALYLVHMRKLDGSWRLESGGIEGMLPAN